MANFDWQDHVQEEYGDEPLEATEGSEQYSGSEVPDGKVAIILGGATFYVVLPEKFAGSLNLLEKGAETAEERYLLTQLLQILKSRGDVLVLDSEGSQFGPEARRKFMAALRQQEAQLASELRKRLQQEVKN